MAAHRPIMASARSSNASSSATTAGICIMRLMAKARSIICRNCGSSKGFKRYAKAPRLFYQQGKGELGAALGKIISSDGAPVVLDQPFANRKAQTQPGFLAADERLKETLADARANARPIVANTYFDPMILGRPAISNRF